MKWSNDFNDVLFCEISIQFLQKRTHSEWHMQSLGHFWVEYSKCWLKVFLKIVPFEAMFSGALHSCSCLDWSEKKNVWRGKKEKNRFPHSVLIDIWEKFLVPLICFHWKHLFKNINVFLVPLLLRGKAYIVWNSNSWEFPVATKNATWRCFLRREQPIESSCRILGMPSLNKQTHSRKKSS